jgi:TetR/AcrR family tetracycline transcriptional repressor
MTADIGDDTTATTGSVRRSWSYGELTRDHVVEAALGLVLREGMSGLSMRKLADELGISSMNAYYHVPNKKALLDLVADSVLGQVPNPPADLAWDEQVRSFFEAGREVLLRYPGVAKHLLVRGPGHPNETRLYLALLGVLTDAGFTRETAIHAQRVLAYLLFGAVTSELATIDADSDADTMAFTDDDEVFRFGLDLMIDGLRALPHTTPGRNAADDR